MTEHLSISKSNWEIAEMYQRYRSGVNVSKLAEDYKLSTASVRRYVRKFEQAARERGLAVRTVM